MPLAFLAGVHGFALLAPYLAVCATAHAMLRQRRRRVTILPVMREIPVKA